MHYGRFSTHATEQRSEFVVIEVTVKKGGSGRVRYGTYEAYKDMGGGRTLSSTLAYGKWRDHSILPASSPPWCSSDQTVTGAEFFVETFQRDRQRMQDQGHGEPGVRGRDHVQADMRRRCA